MSNIAALILSLRILTCLSIGSHYNASYNFATIFNFCFETIDNFSLEWMVKSTFYCYFLNTFCFLRSFAFNAENSLHYWSYNGPYHEKFWEDCTPTAHNYALAVHAYWNNVVRLLVIIWLKIYFIQYPVILH